MSDAIPELVFRSAEKTVKAFCGRLIHRSGQDYRVTYAATATGFELSISPADREQPLLLARLQYTVEIEQWTLHRLIPGDRWSFIPEAGGTLDPNKLLRFFEHDPLHLIWKQ